MSKMEIYIEETDNGYIIYKNRYRADALTFVLEKVNNACANADNLASYIRIIMKASK